MSRTAFMFPGQGAQYIGMGKDFYEQSEESRKAFDKASEVTGLDIAGLCFEENDRLDITEYTQIALLTVEGAMLAALNKMGIRSDVNIGLSLGEYGALLASEVISFEDACRVVRQRGILMEKEVPAGQGAMSAVLGLDGTAIQECLEGIEGSVQIANFNCPGQIVISGEKEAVKAAGEALAQAGAKRVIPLNVSGPFHSDLLKGAGDKLNAVLKNIEINDIVRPYIANVTADYVNDKNEVKKLLEEQVYSSVRFEQSVKKLIEDGVDTFVEIGPGKTLSGFVKKINREVRIFNIEKFQDLETVCGQLVDTGKAGNIC